MLASAADLTPKRMTAMLRDGGHLVAGEVADVTTTTDGFRQGSVADVFRATLTYTTDAHGTLPSSVFVKLSRLDGHHEHRNAGAHEVAFYRAMQGTDTGIPIPTIYGADAHPDSRTHIVMQDLTDTHFQQPLPVPPSNRQCEAIVTALAKLHAHWWNAPRLGTELGTPLTQEAADASHQRLQNSFHTFADYLGDALLPHQRATYERILGSSFLDRLTQRLIARRDVTLTHGDAHTGNMMLPRFAADPMTLIDWHLWGIDLAAFDLAFMIALHWPPDRRALMEKPLLRLYHQELVECGVKDYGWDQFWDDYRTEVIITMLIPIGQHRRDAPGGVVWFGLQDASAAVEDLDCLDLL